MHLPLIRTRVQVRYSDTDALGHISSSSYISFMEVGRLDFYEKVFEEMGKQFTTVVANINLDYIRECVYGDKVEVITYCSKVGSKSLVINTDILANGTLRARGTCTNVGFDPKTRKSCPLPSDWQASDLSGYDGELAD